MTEYYKITGMTCSACQSHVEKAARGVKGVISSSVNLVTSVLSVEGNGKKEDIIKAVEGVGYGITPLENGAVYKKNGDADKKESQKLLNRLFYGALTLVFLMYFSMGGMIGLPEPPDILNGVIQAVISAFILFINGSFFVSGIKSAVKLSPNMDTLVSLGSGVSYLWSLYALIFGRGALYFDSAAMILVFITVGKTLESFSKGRAKSSLDALYSLRPDTAEIKTANGYKTVSARSLKAGDIFAVRPGNVFPADGVVIFGSTSVNEAHLTGESLPVFKEAGGEVREGSVNLTGFVECKVAKVGNDTGLYKIIKAVSDAQATKAPVARLADKVAAVFVPTVIGISLVTFVIWLILSGNVALSLERCVSVLVISCPCALGLATPVAIMVGSGVGAKNGILFKSAPVLESAGKTDIAVFDKTGTVTTGGFEVSGISSATDEKTFVSLFGSLEKYSEHPLGKSIVKYAEKIGADSAVEFDETRAEAGLGITGKIGSDVYYAGSYKYVSRHADIGKNERIFAENGSNNGKTPLFLCKNGACLGVLLTSDTVKPDSVRAIKELENMGIVTVLLSGDNEKTVRSVGKQIGVSHTVSGVLPDEKAEVIKRLKAAGRVIMVGDGINDAPALSEADCGVAIGAGTDVAVESGDVVLMKSSPLDVPAAVKLSGYTLKNVKQNLFFAFLYNIIAIPVAAGALFPFGVELNPMLGALFMSLSSFAVVSNALRINLFKPEKPAKKSKKRVKNEDISSVTDGINEFLSKEKTTFTLKIGGMMCAHCERTVYSAVTSVDGVISASVSHEKGEAEIRALSSADYEKIVSAIEEKGYTVEN